MRIRLLAALVLAVPAWPAAAQTIQGAGARPCAEWRQARAGGGRDYEAEQWALGYVTALTILAALPKRAHAVPVALFAELDTACAAHPDIMLADALKAVLADAHGV